MTRFPRTRLHEIYVPKSLSLVRRSIFSHGAQTYIEPCNCPSTGSQGSLPERAETAPFQLV